MGKAAVIGGGSWGTALTNLITRNGHEVHWWIRTRETVDHILNYRHNPEYLSYLELPVDKIMLSHDLREVTSSCEILIFAIPSAFLSASLTSLDPPDLQGKKIISAIKGMVPSEGMLISDFFRTRFGLDEDLFGILGGPCHSEEIAMEKLSFLTIAMNRLENAGELMSMIANRYVNVSFTDDVKGLEYAGVLKNIYAIANGIAVGLGYGDNFQSVLVSNALMELRSFLERINGRDHNICMPQYTGDLLVTTYSHFSRNRTFGVMVGQGYSAKFAQMEMKMVAEGYYSAKGFMQLKEQMGIDMPIFETVHAILYKGMIPSRAMKELASRLK